MAKAKAHNKKWWHRVHQVVHTDVFKSIAIASFLLNVLFLVCIFVFTSTGSFDRSVYKAAQNRYCKNVEGVEQRAEELNNEQKALDEWRVTCVSKEFQPYYKEAVDKFNAREE